MYFRFHFPRENKAPTHRFTSLFFFFKKNPAIQLLSLPQNNPFQLTKRRLQRRDFNLPLFDMLLRRYFVGNWDVGAKKAMLIVSFEDGKASVGTEAGQKGWSTSRGEKMEEGFIKLLRFLEETIYFVIANVFPSFSVHRSVQIFYSIYVLLHETFPMYVCNMYCTRHSKEEEWGG